MLEEVGASAGRMPFPTAIQLCSPAMLKAIRRPERPSCVSSEGQGGGENPSSRRCRHTPRPQHISRKLKMRRSPIWLILNCHSKVPVFPGVTSFRSGESRPAPVAGLLIFGKESGIPLLSKVPCAFRDHLARLHLLRSLGLILRCLQRM